VLSGEYQTVLIVFMENVARDCEPCLAQLDKAYGGPGEDGQS
jgi:hypothetical protein